jgi:YesN/AraC family two-component response regulator
MIVDDSMLAIQVLKGTLEDLWHKVVSTARTGKAALTAYKLCNPDVVTMDITMPDMDGIVATEKILNSYPDARIIMVTSHAQHNMVVDAIRAGAKGYILKPIKADKLRDALSAITGTAGKDGK